MVSLLSGFIFHLPHFLLLWLAFKMFQIVLELNQALCDQLVLCSSYRAFFSINKIGQRLLKAILPFFAFFFSLLQYSSCQNYIFGGKIYFSIFYIGVEYN